MTRKDIEKRCRVAMEQNLPDKDALWMRIESSLPEQSVPPAAEEKPKRKISVIYRTVAAAACFLFVAGGVMLFGINRIPHNKTAEMAAPAGRQEMQEQDAACEVAEEAADEKLKDNQYKAGLNADYEAAPAQDEDAPQYEMAEEARDAQDTVIPSYTQLQVPQTNTITAKTDRSKLTVSSSLFSEEAVLKQTQAIAKAQVTNGTQDPETGGMQYTLSLLECYDTGEKPENTLVIRSASPYLLEQEHVYVLPLTKTDDGWALSFPDAPQIEATQDGRLLYHSGWTSLWQSGHTLVLCVPQTDEDCYYDKMYLTDNESLDALLDVWASLQ